VVFDDRAKSPSRRRWRTVLIAGIAVVVGLAVIAGVSFGTEFGKRVSGALVARLEGRQQHQSQFAKLMEQARQAMAQNHPRVAVIFLKNAVSEAPKNSDARLLLGVAQLRGGDTASAERELRSARQYGASDEHVLPVLFTAMLARSEGRQLLAQFPAPAEGDKSTLASETLRARAAAFAQTGDSKGAIAALDRALSFDRSSANLVARAQFAQREGDSGLAMKLIDEALSKSPKDVPALLMKVGLLVQAKQNDKALVAANDFVKYYPKSAEALITRAGVYLQLQQHDKALVDINASLKAVPGMPLGVYYKALAMEQAKDVKQAWELAQSLPPAFVNSRAQIGLAVSQLAINAGHLEIGTRMLAGAVSHFPKNVDARVRLAARYLQLKDTERAFQTLQPMADSSDPRIMVLLGQAYNMQHQYSKSIEYFEKASATGIGGDPLKRQIAITNLQAGNLDTATDELTKLNVATPGDPQSAGLLITALLRKQDYATALDVATKLESAAPESPYGPFFQGKLLLRQGDIDGAVSAFSRSIARDKKFVPAVYDRAGALATRGDLKAADADLHIILSDDPKNMMAQIKIAQVAMQAGEKDKAAALLKQAVTAHPKEPLPTLVLARFEAQQGHFDNAAAVVTSFLNQVPNNASVLAMQGEIQLAAGKTGQAVTTFQKLADTYPKSLQIQTLLAAALTKSGNTKGAIATFRKLADTNPKSPEIQMLLAAALAKSGDTKAAMSAYQDAVQLAPNVQATHDALIQFALANKNDVAALSAARSYAEKQPGPASAIALARTYASLNKAGDAVNILAQSQTKYPNSATLIVLTTMLRKQGDTKKADGMFGDWIAKHPDDLTVRMAYAATQLTTNAAAAEEQYRAVLKSQPYNVTALNNMSWLLQQKDPKQALPYAERAAKIVPDSAPILDTLAWTKWLLNDKGGALALLERAHASDSRNGEITYHLVLALDGNGRHADAKKLLAELLASKQEFEDRKKAEALSTKWQ
jgi:putative PEP-CTERM system TPR-repeat lipoprotein